jgi:hypothetical protein
MYNNNNNNTWAQEDVKTLYNLLNNNNNNNNTVVNSGTIGSVSLFGTDLKSELIVQSLKTVILNKSLLVSVSMN